MRAYLARSSMLVRIARSDIFPSLPMVRGLRHLANLKRQCVSKQIIAYCDERA
jgi:hypothetical protein